MRSFGFWLLFWDSVAPTWVHGDVTALTGVALAGPAAIAAVMAGPALTGVALAGPALASLEII